MLHLSVKWAVFLEHILLNNHLSIECRESSATSVLLEVELWSFYFFDEFPVFSCCKWKYFFFFKFALEPKFLFLLVGKLLADQLTWRKTVVWNSAWICFVVLSPSPTFEYHRLTCLASAEAWGWSELCQTNIEMYLIVKHVPFSLLAAPMLSLNPQELFIIFVVCVRLVWGNVMTV